MISAPDRQEACALINEAVGSGARRRLACRELGITARTFERWTRGGALASDRRPGAVRPAPANKLWHSPTSPTRLRPHFASSSASGYGMRGG
jgi:hypothetical protein